MKRFISLYLLLLLSCESQFTKRDKNFAHYERDSNMQQLTPEKRTPKQNVDYEDLSYRINLITNVIPKAKTRTSKDDLLAEIQDFKQTKNSIIDVTSTADSVI